MNAQLRLNLGLRAAAATSHATLACRYASLMLAAYQSTSTVEVIDVRAAVKKAAKAVEEADRAQNALAAAT